MRAVRYEEEEPVARLALSIARLALLSGPDLEQLVSALGNASLSPQASPMAIRRAARSVPSLNEHLSSLVRNWRRASERGEINSGSVALALISAHLAVEEQRKSQPSLEMVWSGPRSLGIRARSTDQVVAEILDGASREILLVGYALTATDVLARIVGAVLRGVHVTAVLHDDPRNIDSLWHRWPSSVEAPRIFTLPNLGSRRDGIVHVKLLVADERAALVTSANMTLHGLRRNMEFGIYVRGDECRKYVKHFDTLISRGRLVELPLRHRE